ncbi:MAG: MFS transporter [Opitutaceae bacterium]|nr:MFS transporter [Opitutaceae bacterium]
MAQIPRPLNRQETRASLAWFNWNVSLRGVSETICGGTTMVFVAFALVIGVPQDSMGYFGAAISCACIVQLLCLPLVSRVRQRKHFILTVAIIEPLLVILAVVLTPTLPPALRPVSLGVAVFLAAACLHLMRPFADDWLATTIPSGLRGRYLGRRVQVSSIAIIASTLGVGYAVEVLGKSNGRGLAVLLIIGALFGLAAALTLSRATMAVEKTTTPFNLGDLLTVLRTRPFVRLVVGTMVFMLPFYFACAYYQVFNLEIVVMRPWLIACMGVGYLAVKLALTPWLGRICDRVGPRRLLWLAGPIYSAFFLCFPFAELGRPWPIIAGWAFVAVADGIYAVAAPAALFGTIPDQGARPAYFAVYNLTSLGCYALGGVLAVSLLRFLQPANLTLGSFHFGGYHLFYALCGLAMIPCTAAIALFPKHSAGGVRNKPTATPA